MADYYSILSKAVSALEPNTASARQRLYERARSAMSAEIEGASPPFDASDIAAVKHGLRSAIERIEAEALPAWLQQESAECANDGSTTADLLLDHGAYRFFEASEIAAAERGLERAIESIEAEAIPDRPRQADEAACAKDCPTTANPSAEIEGSCPDGSEIAAAMQRIESAIEKIKAEAVPALPQQPERAECANDGSTTTDLSAEIERTSLPSEPSKIAAANRGLAAIADWLEQLEPAGANDCWVTADLPAEIEGECPTFHASEIVATKQALEGAIERTEAEAVPAWLRQPEHAARADDCSATAANQNEDSPGPIKKIWTRLTGWAPERQNSPLGQDTWLTDLLERASDEADNDEQSFAPTRAHTQ